MSKVMMVLAGLLVAVFLLGVTACSTVVGLNNQFVSQEAGLKAQYKQNQNNYDNMWKKLKEAAQVPDAYAADLQAIYKSALQGRYGSDGSKAVFQFIKEQNPQVDATLYKQLQQMVEAGRNSFEADQKTLLDKKRIYEVELGTFPNNFVASILGFPKIDLASIDIVTSAETEDAFKTKQSAPIKLK